MVEVQQIHNREEYAPYREKLIVEGEGFLLVYAITSRQSFTQISDFHDEMMRILGSKSDTESTTKSPIFLGGNKCDCEDEREVLTEEGHALARELDCGFVEVSAKSGVNVQLVFGDVVRELRKGSVT